jgi:hypothetical protein
LVDGVLVVAVFTICAIGGAIVGRGAKVGKGVGSVNDVFP